MPESTVLQEYQTSEGVSLQVDPAAGVIRGVKILGRLSRNGREYSPTAIERAARLYEGARVNVDHADPGARRSYADRSRGIGQSPRRPQHVASSSVEQGSKVAVS